jgi:sulfite exporter TauE/SafE/copper chaperone CopZ
MHCASCVVLTETELQGVPEVTNAKASLKNNTVVVTGEFGNEATEIIMERLSKVLTAYGYSLAMEQEKKQTDWSDFKLALPIALGFAALFFLLQKLGLVNLINGNQVGYGTAFTIGIVASLSTCMAVVGGLILSLSTTLAAGGSSKTKPQLFFHISRLVSFFVLGGVIGAISASFHLTPLTTFILNMVIGIVMLILGLNLLDIFKWTQYLQPRLPKFISRKALTLKNINTSFAPALLGLATFFLPCGFTQSMQIYALSTGSFLRGALIMLFFALGTLPVLSLVSFSSFSLGEGAKKNIFFKSAGLIIIMFAIFNIINSLAALGLIEPVFNI